EPGSGPLHPLPADRLPPLWAHTIPSLRDLRIRTHLCLRIIALDPRHTPNKHPRFDAFAVPFGDTHVCDLHLLHARDVVRANKRFLGLLCDVDPPLYLLWWWCSGATPRPPRSLLVVYADVDNRPARFELHVARENPGVRSFRRD